jgi:hypothetical protein
MQSTAPPPRKNFTFAGDFSCEPAIRSLTFSNLREARSHAKNGGDRIKLVDVDPGWMDAA